MQKALCIASEDRGNSPVSLVTVMLQPQADESPNNALHHEVESSDSAGLNDEVAMGNAATGSAANRGEEVSSLSQQV